MIQEFSVENYRSINTKQTLSFLAPEDMQEEDEYLSIEIDESVRLLKLCVLYGYNASGKTNLLKALEFVRNLVLTGPDTKDDEIDFIPFALDEETRKKPGIFALTFFIDKISYEYTLCVDRNRIFRESLVYTPEGRPITLFSRYFDVEKSVSKLTIGSDCELSAKEKIILNGNTLKNSTVLNAFQKSNIHSPALDAVIVYFKETMMPIITPTVLLRDWSLERLASDSTKKQFFAKLMEKADFQIAGLEIKKKRISVADELLDTLTEQIVPNGLLKQLKKTEHLETMELFFTHETTHGSYQIGAEHESQGSLRYFRLGGVLQELLTEPHVVAIDELESSLHQDLANFYLQMFLKNSSESQMLVTTHAQYIMGLDFMRDYMVWFCEKDETGASQYYCAEDYELTTNENLANSYQRGNLGAKPLLGNPKFNRIENSNKPSSSWE